MTDTTQEELPIWVSTAPTDICLGLYWDGGSDEEHAGFPDDHEDICWSEGKNGHGDDNVHYVRADIANQCIATLKAEITVADAACAHWKERAEKAEARVAELEAKLSGAYNSVSKANARAAIAAIQREGDST